MHIQTAAESSCIQCLSKLRYDTEAMRPTSRASWLRTVVVSRFIAIYGQAQGREASSLACLIAPWLNKGWYLSPLIVWFECDLYRGVIVYSHAVSLYRQVIENWMVRFFVTSQHSALPRIVGMPATWICWMLVSHHRFSRLFKEPRNREIHLFPTNAIASESNS